MAAKFCCCSTPSPKTVFKMADSSEMLSMTAGVCAMGGVSYLLVAPPELLLEPFFENRLRAAIEGTRLFPRANRHGCIWRWRQISLICQFPIAPGIQLVVQSLLERFCPLRKHVWHLRHVQGG